MTYLGCVGIVEMIRIDDFRLYSLYSLPQLFQVHSESAHREECYRDILKVLHLRDIFRIAGNIYSESVEIENVSVPSSLRMPLCVLLRDVVCWYTVDYTLLSDVHIHVVLHDIAYAHLIPYILWNYQLGVFVG